MTGTEYQELAMRTCSIPYNDKEAIGATMDEAMEMNIQKLRERYPEGFQAEKSLHRSPGDI